MTNIFVNELLPSLFDYFIQVSWRSEITGPEHRNFLQTLKDGAGLLFRGFVPIYMEYFYFGDPLLEQGKIF